MTEAMFRFTKNAILGGQSSYLTIEGSLDKKIVGKKCCVKLYEVDKEKKLYKLAEFVTGIREIPFSSPPEYKFAVSVRTDEFVNTLPHPEVISETAGTPPNDVWTINFRPNWKPAHFYFALDDGQGKTMHTIIVDKNKTGEKEGYIFEIGAKVFIDDKLIFDSTTKRAYMTVSCVNLLVHNSVQSTELVHKKHREMISKRVDSYAGKPVGMGIGYGTDWANRYEKPSPRLVKRYHLKEYGCLGYCYEILKRAHEKTNLEQDWTIINKQYLTRKIGNTLAKGLEMAGWVCIFFYPDLNAKYDQTQDHLNKYNERTLEKARSGNYFDIRVSHVMADYVPDFLISKYNADIARLKKKVKFGFVQTYNHSALIIDGYVHECHWNRGYYEIELFDDNGLAELRKNKAIGKPFEIWRLQDCGIIMVPPGLW